MTYQLKINGTIVDLGVMLSMTNKIISNNVVIPPLEDGQTAIMLKWGPPYRQFEISGTYIGTESEINIFTSRFLGAMQYPESNPVLFTMRFDVTAIDCLITNFSYDDNGGIPGRVPYTLQLTEMTYFS